MDAGSRENLLQSNNGPQSPQFESSCNLLPKLFRYMYPKSIRLKLITILTVTCLSVLIFIYLSCFSSSDEYSICHTSKLIPQLNFFTDNTTHRHFPQQHRRLPQCIIIGIRKAGTRALVNYLGLHPDVVTASKEPHFFDRDENYNQGLEYYRGFMPPSYKEQITIEKTPAYFTEAMVPERLYRMNSSIRLLLIVREPVTRLISDFTQLYVKNLRRNMTPIPFEVEVLDSQDRVDLTYKPVMISMYYKHITRWMDFFSWEQIHIVDGDRLISDPYSEMYKVETFLGIDHRIQREQFFFNKTKGFFCVIREESSRSCLQESKGRKHPPVDPALLKKLFKFYAPRNKLFFEFINRTFEWEKIQEQLLRDQIEM